MCITFCIHSVGMCRMRRFFAVLGSFFHSSLLYTFSFHPFPPTSLQSSLTSSCHLFLGLPLSLGIPKFIYNTLWGILFPSILCTCPNQRNLFNLIVSVLVGFFNDCINFFIGWYSPIFFSHCHILSLKFFYTLSFWKCLFVFYLSLLVYSFLMHVHYIVHA